MPATTAPTLMSACTEPSTSSETEAVNEDEVEVERQLMLVLNRFSLPENLKGQFSDTVLLNAVAFSTAAGESNVGGPGKKVWSIGNTDL